MGVVLLTLAHSMILTEQDDTQMRQTSSCWILQAWVLHDCVLPTSLLQLDRLSAFLVVISDQGQAWPAALVLEQALPH